MFLFIDRDGVINKRIVGDYVRDTKEWQWLPKVVEAIVILSHHFERVFVITNQQGIGKGYFSIENLDEIHSLIIKRITKKGGKIDGIYYCPHLKTENCDCRKPKIGLALQAQRDFPEVDFRESIMVGDTISDMEFGRNAGMKTVFITTDHEPSEAHLHLIDEVYGSLWEFAEYGSFI